MDVRDKWESAESPIPKLTESVGKLLGLPVALDLNWLFLWGELHAHFPDQQTFVPTITATIKAWLDCLKGRLEDDGLETWTEQLLEEVQKSSQSLKARVDVGLSINMLTWSCILIYFTCRLTPALKSGRNGRRKPPHL